MTYIDVEAPEKTITRFIESPSWQSQIEEKNLALQLISVSRETNRKPDTIFFEVVDNVLIDPVTQKPILSIIKRGTALEEIEYQTGVQLQKWASKNDSGIAVWISPRSLEYPCEKISIHQIAYELKEGKIIKVIRNSYILFDAILKNPEELRRFIFTEKDTERSIPGILEWISKVSKRNVETDTSDHTKIMYQATQFAGMIRSEVPTEIIVEEMKQTGFLGENPISCPGSDQGFSNILNSRAEGFIFSGAEKGPSRFCSTCEGYVKTYIVEGKIYCSLCGQCLGTL